MLEQEFDKIISLQVLFLMFSLKKNVMFKLNSSSMLGPF